MTTKIRGTRQIQGGTVGSAELASTAVTPGEYGDATHVPVVTVDADGRITAASEVAVSGGGGGISDGDKGDITVSSSGAVWTIDPNAVTFAKMQAITDGKLLGASGGTVVEEIGVSTGLQITGNNLSSTITQYTDELAQDAVGGMVDGTLVYVDVTPLLTRAALTGDVTAPQASNATTIANDAVSNAKLANMATDTIKGRATASTGDPEDLTALPFAFTGDVTRAADSNAQVIPNDTVTYAKMQNISAADRLLGRGNGGGSGDVQEIALGTNLSLSGTTLNAANSGSLVVKEVDGSPSVSGVTEIKVSNGTLTDNTGGSVTITTGGGGGGGAAAHATMWHDEAQTTVGTALAVPTLDANQQYGWWVGGNSSVADGDTFINQFSIAAGTYTFHVLGITASSRGMIDWYIDNVAFASAQDWYSGGLTYNVFKTAASVVISEGAHVLKGVINGKNGSSSNYQMLLTKYWFAP